MHGEGPKVRYVPPLTHECPTSAGLFVSMISGVNLWGTVALPAELQAREGENVIVCLLNDEHVNGNT